MGSISLYATEGISALHDGGQRQLQSEFILNLPHLINKEYILKIFNSN